MTIEGILRIPNSFYRADPDGGVVYAFVGHVRCLKDGSEERAVGCSRKLYFLRRLGYLYRYGPRIWVRRANRGNLLAWRRG